jgi:hypothetical protein
VRQRDAFPHKVREIEHAWIPLADGTRLAARLWLPERAHAQPVPAVLEYLPYGKREGTRERDEPMHRWFAGYGFAALRVDLRGSGESEGVLRDEYLEQELRDGEEVLAWITAQPWCNGALGIIGKSWGGFNALMLAARRPPALRAVISVCASDDRYADDAHWMGGCLLLENFRWGATLFTLMGLPPDPALVGDGWRDVWRERLASAMPPAVTWLRHPLRDTYWRHGSVCEDYARIQVPVLSVSGWADGYRNAVPRLATGLGGRSRGLIGPWAHLLPHEGQPGPAIGFLQEARRWWERWLRGAAAEEEMGGDEPALRLWLQERAGPEGAQGERAGRWIAESAWPSREIDWRSFSLAADGLGGAATQVVAREVASPQTTGETGGPWCSFGADLPGDQAPDDARSLSFDSAPLAERVEIVGAARVHLALAADRPSALVAVRLCDVAPDGSSERIAWGLLNLTHREGHERTLPLRPGERVEVELDLSTAAHAVPAGNRLRVALSSTYWPSCWPSPEPVRLTVFAGAGSLALPVRTPRPEDARLRAFDAPEAAPGPEVLHHPQAGGRRSVSRDARTGEWVCVTTRDLDADAEPLCSRFPQIDLEVGYGVREELRIRDDDPLSARFETRHVSVARRGAWQTRVETQTRVRATREHFLFEATLRAWEAGGEVFARRFEERVPRVGV